MGADAGTLAGAAGVGGVGLCMGGLSKQGDERSKRKESRVPLAQVKHQLLKVKKEFIMITFVLQILSHQCT
jgi:hypothetical protein